MRYGPEDASAPPAAPLSPEVVGRIQELPFVGIAMTSAASKRWIQVNQAMCDMLGYSHAELLERTWADLTHPEDLARDVAAFERVVRGEVDSYQLDKRYLHKRGDVVHATINVKASRGADGQLEYFIATVTDITARVAAETAAREAAALLRNLSQQVPGVIYQFQLLPDGRSRFPFASDAIADIYEVTPAEVRDDAAAVFARLHPDDVDRVGASIAASAETLTPWRCTYRVRLPRRGLRWLAGHARPERLADGSTLWHGYITDATEAEQARAALAESEQRYRILVEHAPEAIVVLEADGCFLDANSNAERLFGWSRDELLARGVEAISPPRQPDGRASAAAAPPLIARALAGEVVAFEWVHRDATGRDFPCEIHLTRIPFAGRLLVRGSVLDISERTHARDHLRRLQAAIECASSGLALADRDGRLTYVNAAFLALWGHTRAEDVLGQNVLAFWRSPDEAAAVVAALGHGTWSGELIAQRLDGSERTVAVVASAFTDASGAPAGMLGSFTDVTEARALAAQLVQSQKLESLGRLAGGIAHDFNNLLTVIKGYLTVALSSLDPGDLVADDLHEVDRAADSAAALTRQLLAVSRRQVIAPVTLDLNAVVRRVHGMLERILGEDVALVLATAADLAPVRFDPGQAEQLLLNLAANARDAMPDGGQLTIATANVRFDADDARTRPGVEPGAFVRLTVADTGVGMRPDVREHAFEPFFTTKDIGKGSGLGLAMVHGAVAQNGGRIELDSAPGHGTAFQIYLPVAPAAAPVPDARRTTGLPRGHETVLLVEDDADVRGLARRLIEPLGYRVYDHESGAAALAWLAATDAPVDLLLTDVIMPAMNGRELADRVAALRPTIRVLFVSGYTADLIAHHGVLEPGVEFLAKPYTREALATRLRDLLDGPARPASAR